MKNSNLKAKAKRYRKFFRRVKKFGMFKSVIYDSKFNSEYLYPGVKMDPRKAELIVLSVLLLCLAFVLKFRIVGRFNNPVVLKKSKIHLRIDKFGMSNLHRAVIYNKEEVVLKLLEYGADINMKDSWGWTPLHWARFLGSKSLGNILLAHGASDEDRTEKQWYRIKSGTTPDEISPVMKSSDFNLNK